MTKLINPDWVVQFDWEELDGQLVEIQVHVWEAIIEKLRSQGK